MWELAWGVCWGLWLFLGSALAVAALVLFVLVLQQW